MARRSATLPDLPGEAMLHPALLVAVAVLLLNDHVLKSAAPGLVTGKLSDFAGLFFFPALLQAGWEIAHHVLGRPWRRSDRVLCAASILTMVLFTWVKLCPSGGEAYRLGLAALQRAPELVSALITGSHAPLGRAELVHDASDLIALPAALAGAWVARRSVRPQGGDRKRDPSRLRRCRAWVSGVVTFAVASSASLPVAHAQPDAPARSNDDPTRPGQSWQPFGFYARGGFGIGSGSVSLGHTVSVETPTRSGSGRLVTEYGGYGFAADVVAALRIYRALVGAEYVLGTAAADAAPSEGSRELGIEPSSSATWHIIGPMGGVQIGRHPLWVLGGSMGWAALIGGDFTSAQGARVESSIIDASGISLSIWGGPAFRLSSGLLLGAHVRFSVVRDSIAFFAAGIRESASQAAILMDLSYQAP